ncbi:hypothetical protein AVEN_81325-1 [Araneus ventricosus]|uniref:Uncharacterized protein n=1 Tax=Araneus ventricosus TaxID=182803 RepID=A0A4Y2B5P9_ARAVE|nr:hypothetical protein AVEN_81325-1 [Araneus ventricosus]
MEQEKERDWGCERFRVFIALFVSKEPPFLLWSFLPSGHAMDVVAAAELQRHFATRKLYYVDSRGDLERLMIRFTYFLNILRKEIFMDDIAWDRTEGLCCTGTMAGATNRITLQNECGSATSLVGGIEERSALILVHDLRNAAYLRLFKLCPLAGALYMAKNIFSPACEIASAVDEVS